MMLAGSPPTEILVKLFVVESRTITSTTIGAVAGELVPDPTVSGCQKAESPFWQPDTVGSGTNSPATAPMVVDVIVRDSTTKSFTRISVGGLPASIIQRT